MAPISIGNYNIKHKLNPKRVFKAKQKCAANSFLSDVIKSFDARTRIFFCASRAPYGKL